MNLLLAIASVVTVVGAAVPLENILDNNTHFEVGYSMQPVKGKVMYGHVELRSPLLRVHYNKLLNALIDTQVLVDGILNANGNEIDIKMQLRSAETTELRFGLYEKYFNSFKYGIRPPQIEQKWNLYINVYLLPVPLSANLKEGDLVYGGGEKGTRIKVFVVLLDKKLYVMCTMDSANLSVTIWKTESGGNPLFTVKPSPEVKGPFVAIPIKLTRGQP